MTIVRTTYHIIPVEKPFHFFLLVHTKLIDIKIKAGPRQGHSIQWTNSLRQMWGDNREKHSNNPTGASQTDGARRGIRDQPIQACHSKEFHLRYQEKEPCNCHISLTFNKPFCYICVQHQVLLYCYLQNSFALICSRT